MSVVSRHTRTFLLGVGAQKAGTTWVHEYINSFDEACMGIAKEYHIFNALHDELCANQKLTPLKVFRTKPRLPFLPYPPKELTIRFLMQRLESFYEMYFARLARGNVRITGDITPCYAGLDAPTFALIKRRLETRGFRVKALFLMRDPVERCWSSVRHHHRVLRLSGRQPRHKSDIEHLRHTYMTDQMQFRTRYQATIANLESVFPPEDLWFGLYETLFSEPEVNRLSEFLGVETNHAFAKKQVQVSPKTKPELDAETKRLLRDFYADVYEYCYERFPSTREVWS